jgi:DNA transformation protein and related proteins
MAVSESYLAFVLEQLAGVRAVVTKRMFGGVGIYSDGVFFAVIDNDTLFFKVDDALRPRYHAAGMPAFAPMPGKPAMEGYYQVPPTVLEDADELAKWAKRSLALPVTKAAAKPRTKSRTKSRQRGKAG